jgi:hypothetical protein
MLVFRFSQLRPWIALMMETVPTSETLVNSYQSTRRYNPEHSHLQKRLWWHSCIAALVPRSFAAILAQAQAVIHNIPHLPACLRSYVKISCHIECTSTVLFAVFRTDCCPCVRSPWQLSARNADVIPANTNTNVSMFINESLYILTLQSLVVNICTICFNSHFFSLFRTILTVNSNYFLKQRYPVDLCNGEELCFLCGTNWILK